MESTGGRGKPRKVKTMPKFKAPEHVTGIHTCGEFIAADEHGIATVDNPSPGVLAGLQSAGWTKVDEAEAPPAKTPSKPTGEQSQQPGTAGEDK